MTNDFVVAQEDKTVTGNGHHDHATETAVPMSNEELAALGSAARDLLPEESFLVGKPLRWSYETGRWYFEITTGKDTQQIFVETDEEFVVDLRSYTETLIRRQDKKVTHRIGGRRIDGWINCSHDELPDRDESKWPLFKNEPSDPWTDGWQIVLRRLDDEQLFTWEASSYWAKRGLGEFLDAAYKEAVKNRGEMPVVDLNSYTRDLNSGGQRWVPLLRVIGWAVFGHGASPPADRHNLERIQKKLRAIKDELATDKTKAKTASPGSSGGARGDMDDEIPF